MAAAGMLFVSSLAPKAQNAVKYVAEGGALGGAKSAPAFMAGVNAGLAKGKNFVDVYAGPLMGKNTGPGAVAMVMDEFSHTPHISSWTRGFFMFPKKCPSTLTTDVAPIKVNTAYKNVNFSAMPAYNVNYDFTNKTSTQSVKVITQTVYSATPKDRVCLELQYGSNPTHNLKDMHFGSFRDGFGYTVTYARSL